MSSRETRERSAIALVGKSIKLVQKICRYTLLNSDSRKVTDLGIKKEIGRPR